ncbi:MAG: Unknown protein [uncultured Thiotrichaceae bacterium]|uniref:SCP domain-containing protein n=1 Tax=uncultured Thiotrichaceae bacterium TaxID=298394 RepID=A0A6S6SG94_9GAMM|nr:MAG: Unknown protein [uncultured Thiotrichaceae bacterium]
MSSCFLPGLFGRDFHTCDFLCGLIFLTCVTEQACAEVVTSDNNTRDFRNASAPAVAISAAAEHNVIRDAVSQQKTLTNLGYFLTESYDFSQQPAPAQALPALQDSQAMQASAAQHAQACVFNHVNSPYGQNLFAGTGTRWTVEQAVNSWADEARHYDFDTDSCVVGEQCGHYTQLVWENTRTVGCVVQQCNQMTDSSGSAIFNGRSGMMIFCHYDPPGNFRSQMAYRKATDVVGEDLAFNLKVMLQGAYEPASGMMRQSPANRALAAGEPYSALGYAVSGVSLLNSNLMNNTGSDAPVDWILVELRSAADPAEVVDSIAAMVQRDGDVMRPDTGSTTLVFENQPIGNYYLAVRHRNHLGVMTRQPVTLSASPVVVDFSGLSTPVWGRHARFDVAGTAVLWAGDVNHDGRIISAGVANDAGLILETVLLGEGNSAYAANYIVQEYSAADVSLDGKVIQAGVGNDTNYIRANVLLHPENTLGIANFIITQQLP